MKDNKNTENTKKITIALKELTRVLDILSIRCKDAIQISVNTKIKDDSGNCMAAFNTCDGNVSIITNARVAAKEDMKIIVGSELIDIVKALSSFGSEVNIEFSTTSAMVFVGNAKSPLSIKTEILEFALANVKRDKNAAISLNTQEFVKGLKEGSFAYADSSNAMPALALTVSMNIEKDKDCDDYYLKFISSDGHMAGRTVCKALKVGFQNCDNAYEKVQKSINIDAPAMRSISNRLTGNTISMFIYDNQIQIQDGFSFYIIKRYDTNFPKQIGELLDKDDYQYSFKINSPLFKAGLKVATLLDSDKLCILSVEEGCVKLHSKDGLKEAKIEAEEVNGSVKIGFNSRLVETILNNVSVDKVQVCGASAATPIYIKAEGIETLTLPVKMNEK